MIPTPRTIELHDTDGLAFAATEWDGGRREAVVLVHGLLGTRSLREIIRVAEALAPRRDVVAIDVRGHGDSPGRFTWGREEWKQVAAAVAHAARPGRSVAVVGFSYGGYHAVRAAARGAPIARLVLVGAPADLHVLDHFPFGPKLWRHVPAVLNRRRRRLRAEAPPRPAEAKLTDEELRRVTAPALVVHGGSDWLISSRHAERYAAGLPSVRRAEIAGGFHGEYLVHSHGDELIALIAAFLP
ncbi:MAG TPA: alpha/beta fold hydrolase [Candidatus Polarisedimenticolaceae bacterium]|nr:alpha/beta fold hydrolase [Candidatus Polarisedimenticolaceae bacterium]